MKDTAAKSLQSCPTLCNPIDGSPPGSPVPGILQQEHWSGLPFPPSRHESEKWKWSRSVVSDSSRPHGLQPTSLLCPWDFPGKSTGVGCHHLLQESPTALSIFTFLVVILFFARELFQFHRTGKGQFSFLSQRKAMPKNFQTITQLHSLHMLTR